MTPKPDIPRTDGSPSVALADKIVTAIEGHFRDWLMHGEHTEAAQLVAEIIDRELDGWALEFYATEENGARPRWLWRFVRLLMKWRYGVRGALKPPLGCWYLHREQTLVGQIENALYRWRHLCWRADSWLYQHTGLPEEWNRWMREPNGQGRPAAQNP